MARVKSARAEGQKAENEAFDLMIRIGLSAVRERDEWRARAEAAEAALALMPRPEDRCRGEWPCEASTHAASLEAEAALLKAETYQLRTAIEKVLDHLTVSVPGMRLTLTAPSVELARDTLIAVLAEA